MDLRIILSYIQRHPWLWGWLVTSSLVMGFFPRTHENPMFFILFFYLALMPLSTEYQPRGNMFIHQILPVSERTLARTAWAIVTLLPIIGLTLSLLPALGFSLLTGSNNSGSVNLIPLIIGGLLLTNFFFVFMTLKVLWHHSKPIFIVTAVGMLVAGILIGNLVQPGLYPTDLSTRLSLASIALVLVLVSYTIAMRLVNMAETGMIDWHRKTHVTITGNKTLSIRERLLSSPAGRALNAGVFLLALMICTNMIFAFRAGRVDWWTLAENLSIISMFIFMAPMMLYITTNAHIISFRSMACLPVSQIRRTIILVSLPLISAAPSILCLAVFTMLMTSYPTDSFKLSVLAVFCLSPCYLGLAFSVRDQSNTAAVSFGILSAALMLRFTFAGHFVLTILDILLPIGLILLAVLSIHHSLARQNSLNHLDRMFAGAQQN